MKKCYDCTHVEMCGWRKEVKEQGCEFFDDGMVWIPVSERLPEKDGSYLVCMSWHFQKMDVLTWADGWNCTRNINGKVNRKSEILGAYIIAWMPLPEPYREDDEE